MRDARRGKRRKGNTLQVNPYLNFDGQCAAAFRFYEQLLRGKIVAMLTHAEAPAQEPVPAASRDRIMHARLEAGDAVLMGSDSPPGQFQKAGGMYVALQVKDPAEAERVFRGLAEGGELQMPIQETFWVTRFGMVVDRFGTPWMVSCEKAAG